MVNSQTIYAKTIQIYFTAYDTYSVEVAHIDVGDIIEWLPNVDHNVEFLGGPNMNSLPEKSGFNSFYKVNFDLPGVYLYHAHLQPSWKNAVQSQEAAPASLPCTRV